MANYHAMNREELAAEKAALEAEYKKFQACLLYTSTHTAVAFHVAAQKKRSGVPMVVLSTASPFKLSLIHI